MRMIYYAYKQAVKDGKVTVTNKSSEKKDDMEHQYCLFRANSVKNEDDNDMSVCEWGSITGGMYERKIYQKEQETVEQ